MADKVFVIAEAGVNHNGQSVIAKEMIDAAVDAQADAVKFQMFKVQNLVTSGALKTKYQRRNTNDCEKNQYQMLVNLELSLAIHKELSDYARKRNILFIASPFDLDSVEALIAMDPPMFKIPSGEIDNVPYLRAMARINKPILLSTGMSTLPEIANAMAILQNGGTPLERITLLHCLTEYPAPFDEVNLRAMVTLQQTFNTKIGYSDHTLGYEVAVAAVALGAQVIEKHFTLDRTLPGPDHKASLLPIELQQMITAIRNIELALGDGQKRPMPSELENKICVRKSIVAKTKIKKGELFSTRNLTVKRPGTGRSPIFWDSLIGQVAQKDYLEDDLI